MNLKSNSNLHRRNGNGKGKKNIFKFKIIDLLHLNLFVFFGLVSFSAHSAIALDRTRIIFDSSMKSISLGITNQNKRLPYLAQGWMEDESGKKVQSPFTVLPPVQRIEPGKPSQIKIQSLPTVHALPNDRETLFYFNLREIPPRSDKPNTLQIALQTRIKFFYRPESIRIEKNVTPPQVGLKLINENGKLILNNVTPYYITIVDIKSAKNSSYIKNFEPVMVAPKDNAPLGVTASEVGNSPVLSYINDYGARPELFFKCVSSVCEVSSSDKNGI